MGIKFRKSFGFGPWRWNVTQNGVTSRTTRLGPFSRNSRTRRARINLPGAFYWTGRRR